MEVDDPSTVPQRIVLDFGVTLRTDGGYWIVMWVDVVTFSFDKSLNLERYNVLMSKARDRSLDLKTHGPLLAKKDYFRHYFFCPVHINQPPLKWTAAYIHSSEHV